MNRGLFRAKSFDRMASPEQIDQNLNIITPKWWLLLFASFLFILLFLIWGVFGTLNTKVYGTGVVITEGGLEAVQSQFGGEISEIYIAENKHVNAGDVVAKIIIHPREAELKKLKNQLEIHRARLEKLDEETEIETAAVKNKYKFLRLKENFSLESKKKDYELKKWETQEFSKLLNKGAVSKLRYSDAMVEVNNLFASVNIIEKGLPLLDVNERIELAQKKVEQVDDRKEFDILAGQIESIENQLMKDSTIKSKYTGMASSYFYAPGDYIREGDVIGMIDPDNHGVVVYAMFASDDGKKIVVGSKAYISPSTVNKEKYGTMVGTVTKVTRYPVTSKAMENYFQSDSLVKKFSKIDSPIGVEIYLDRDESTVSGYKWTNGKGPAIEITRGTSVSASVTVKKEAPVELLIPFLRKITGINA
ncbi:NHLP bacteriocin system secretion protein [Francisella philomiragia]|uniref:NHLP bacteriocin system secretion protein n=1 Tax=Francisella philomiragia TaxID=28110 RepID=UPI001905B260|nr:NHLP bacteriocin system secretion protein [Francisella philomiragia]MBK2026161.1 NHLP bacteriocin system secretion protein [Francisella philomiragia]